MGCRVDERKNERNGADGIEQEKRTGSGVGLDHLAFIW